jgi:hypothetical protein
MTPYFDRPPAGWFALDVMRTEARKGWVALMVDTDPDELRHCAWKAARSAWVPISGKHRTRDAAWDALESMMAVRH